MRPRRISHAVESKASKAGSPSVSLCNSDATQESRVTVHCGCCMRSKAGIMTVLRRSAKPEAGKQKQLLEACVISWRAPCTANADAKAHHCLGGPFMEPTQALHAFGWRADMLACSVVHAINPTARAHADPPRHGHSIRALLSCAAEPNRSAGHCRRLRSNAHHLGTPQVTAVCRCAGSPRPCRAPRPFCTRSKGP